MPLFEKTIPVRGDVVAGIVQHYWHLMLGDIIKASQNHTFNASNERGNKFVVRVTPDPTMKHQQRVEDEIFFVKFIANSGLQHVCGPVHVVDSTPFDSSCGDVKVSDGGMVLRANNLIIVVFSWAIGGPLNFLEYRWMLDEAVVRAVGVWFATFHRLSRNFSTANPDVALRIQRWNEIHDGVLTETVVDAQDLAVVEDPMHFGVIHGDVNCSNYFYDDGQRVLSVFDWDQTQRGWYLWDVAQAVFTVVMLSEAGLPIAGTPVLEAKPAAFIELLVAGYESVAGVGAVDRERLSRMVELRKQFYELFCRRAQAEGDVPLDMAAFIDYIVAWFDRSRTI